MLYVVILQRLHEFALSMVQVGEFWRPWIKKSVSKSVLLAMPSHGKLWFYHWGSTLPSLDCTPKYSSKAFPVTFTGALWGMEFPLSFIEAYRDKFHDIFFLLWVKMTGWWKSLQHLGCTALLRSSPAGTALDHETIFHETTVFPVVLTLFWTTIDYCSKEILQSSTF